MNFKSIFVFVYNYIATTKFYRTNWAYSYYFSIPDKWTHAFTIKLDLNFFPFLKKRSYNRIIVVSFKKVFLELHN